MGGNEAGVGTVEGEWGEGGRREGMEEEEGGTTERGGRAIMWHSEEEERTEMHYQGQADQ